MIRQTSSDKIRGKQVKYRLGDCLSIKINNEKYIGALMTGKFNAYYNLTFMNFEKNSRPEINDFMNGLFFGTRFGSWEELTYAVDQRMIKCKFVDNELNIERIGSIELISNFISAGYSYLETIEQMNEYYCNEMPIRVEKSKNAEKFPEIAFVSKHLIELKKIII
jgi:hypothetical protein